MESLITLMVCVVALAVVGIPIWIADIRARQRERQAAAYRWELQQRADIGRRRRADLIWNQHVKPARRPHGIGNIH